MDCFGSCVIAEKVADVFFSFVRFKEKESETKLPASILFKKKIKRHCYIRYVLSNSIGFNLLCVFIFYEVS